MLHGCLFTGYVACGPCCLEVETTRYGVYVEYFSGKEEAFAHLTFKCILIDIAKTHTATGDKFVTETTLPANRVLVVDKRFNQLVHGLFPYFAPRFGHTQPLFYQ